MLSIGQMRMIRMLQLKVTILTLHHSVKGIIPKIILYNNYILYHDATKKRATLNYFLHKSAPINFLGKCVRIPFTLIITICGDVNFFWGALLAYKNMTSNTLLRELKKFALIKNAFICVPHKLTIRYLMRCVK